jgi:hypothetical protein
MTTLTANASSLSLLLHLNADRLIWLATVAAALGGGAWIGSMMVSVPQATTPFF